MSHNGTDSEHRIGMKACLFGFILWTAVLAGHQEPTEAAGAKMFDLPDGSTREWHCRLQAMR